MNVLDECDRTHTKINSIEFSGNFSLKAKPQLNSNSSQILGYSYRHLWLLEITSSLNTSLVSISFIRPKANNKFQPSPNTSSLSSEWLDLYWRRIIRPDGSSVEKDHPSSINTGRTMRRTIGVSCDSSRVL